MKSLKYISKFKKLISTGDEGVIKVLQELAIIFRDKELSVINNIYLIENQLSQLRKETGLGIVDSPSKKNRLTKVLLEMLDELQELYGNELKIIRKDNGEIFSDSLKKELEALSESGRVKEKKFISWINNSVENEEKEHLSPYLNEKIKVARINLPKQLIAEHIVQKYIKNFDSIFLDSDAMLDYVFDEILKKRSFLSILTNSIGIYEKYLRKDKPSENEVFNSINTHEFILTGGVLNKRIHSFTGQYTAKMILEFNTNVSVIYCSGISSNGGLFCFGAEEIQTKKALIQSPSDLKILITEEDRFGKRGSHKFGSHISEVKKHAEKVIVITSKDSRGSTYDDAKVEFFKKEIEKIAKGGIYVDIIKIE